MERGLLQHDILAVLDKRRGWSRPKEILAALNRDPTATNRVAISKALKRLWERGLIDMTTPEVYDVGKSNLYRARRRR